MDSGHVNVSEAEAPADQQPVESSTAEIMRNLNFILHSPQAQNP